MAAEDATDPLEAQVLALFRDSLAELWGHVLRRAGGERALAEDVLQEAWLRAVRAWRRDGLPAAPEAWLKTAAQRLLLQHWRAERRRPRRAEPVDLDALALDDAASPGALGDGLAPAAAALVQRGLAALRPDDAELVQAFHLEGRSTRELAAAHARSERAIEGRLHRARRRLKTILARLAKP